MFEYEGGRNYADRKQRLNRNFSIVKDMKEKLRLLNTNVFDSFDSEMWRSVVCDLNTLISVLSDIIKEGRQLVLKQTFGKI